ncbi:glycoside hydrolase family 53 [Lecanosticta acicola]|uniref:Arabinogalactan endo-beta-1,4-galactanase n=1 Tax=Lecanosticta acicola TaxID=111012 RepID=A0AAI8Z5Q0_9PEZI|nr:glycoside hydrolase family 53 [Lecanosticta acicola]
MRSGFLLALAASQASAALTYKGVDWSSLLVEENAGYSYSTVNGKTEPLENILVDSGVTTVRQRLWNNPSAGNYNLDYNLKLAARAKAAGLDIYLDIHYSDTWADPANQAVPAAWANYDIDELVRAIHDFTLNTMNAFASAGIPLTLVSIGNEITNGLLFPLGTIEKQPQNTARLLHSASAGIKASKLSKQPKILIHLDNGWKSETQEWWYDTVLKQGPFLATDYDVQAVSYYPFYNADATLASLKSSLSNLKSKYGKEVMVVETDWPTYCPKPDYAFPADASNIPFSAAGQTTWVQDVASVLEDVSGAGLFYWEPAWIKNAGLGSSCKNNLMVDQKGQALSSLSVFGQI